MNTKIVNLLISLNNDYEKMLQTFSEKNDLSKAFEFECENYVQKLTDDIIPQLYEQLQSNPDDKVEFYFPYIKTKYHSTTVEEIKSIKTNDEQRIYNLGKKIIVDFNHEILIHKGFKDIERNQFLDNFYNKNISIFNEILEQDPYFYVKIVSSLRSPKIQYKMLNKNKEVISKISIYLNKVEKVEFEKFLRDSVFYPTDIEMDDYYNKWIGKDKIHVKFLKGVLGERYEYAKLFVKMSVCGKKPKNMTLS